MVTGRPLFLRFLSLSPEFLKTNEAIKWLTANVTHLFSRFYELSTTLNLPIEDDPSLLFILINYYNLVIPGWLTYVYKYYWNLCVFFCIEIRHRVCVYGVGHTVSVYQDLPGSARQQWASLMFSIESSTVFVSTVNLKKNYTFNSCLLAQ